VPLSARAADDSPAKATVKPMRTARNPDEGRIVILLWRLEA
jgi:hypothetical protein